MKWPIVLWLLVFAPTAAPAQQAALDSVKNARLYSRLTLVDGGAALGRVERLNADSVWLRFDREALPLSAIASIETRMYRPDPIINGAVLGAAVGVGVGLLLTTVCIGCESSVHEGGIVLGSALFGALAGFIVDIAREEWDWNVVWSADR